MVYGRFAFFAPPQYWRLKCRLNAFCGTARRSTRKKLPSNCINIHLNIKLPWIRLCELRQIGQGVIGTRHGEKLYETLVNREEMAKATELEHYYQIPADNRDLNYERYFSEGEADMEKIEEYHSHNTHRLDVKGTKNLLLKLNSIVRDVKSQMPTS